MTAIKIRRSHQNRQSNAVDWTLAFDDFTPPSEEQEKMFNIGLRGIPGIDTTRLERSGRRYVITVRSGYDSDRILHAATDYLVPRLGCKFYGLTVNGRRLGWYDMQGCTMM